MISTIETRLKLDTIQESIFDSCIALWASYRKAWKLLNKKLTESEIYRHLINLNLLTSTQIKSIINKVTTEHAKIRELTKTQLKNH